VSACRLGCFVLPVGLRRHKLVPLLKSERENDRFVAEGKK
jgi:hypothetical protein